MNRQDWLNGKKITKDEGSELRRLMLALLKKHQEEYPDLNPYGDNNAPFRGNLYRIAQAEKVSVKIAYEFTRDAKFWVRAGMNWRSGTLRHGNVRKELEAWEMLEPIPFKQDNTPSFGFSGFATIGELTE